MSAKSTTELSRRHSALQQRYANAGQGREQACKSASIEINREWLQVQVSAAGGSFHNEQMGVEVVL